MAFQESENSGNLFPNDQKRTPVFKAPETHLATLRICDEGRFNDKGQQIAAGKINEQGQQIAKETVENWIALGDSKQDVFLATLDHSDKIKSQKLRNERERIAEGILLDAGCAPTQHEIKTFVKSLKIRCEAEAAQQVVKGVATMTFNAALTTATELSLNYLGADRRIESDKEQPFLPITPKAQTNYEDEQKNLLNFAEGWDRDNPVVVRDVLNVILRGLHLETRQSLFENYNKEKYAKTGEIILKVLRNAGADERFLITQAYEMADQMAAIYNEGKTTTTGQIIATWKDIQTRIQELNHARKVRVANIEQQVAQYI